MFEPWITVRTIYEENEKRDRKWDSEKMRESKKKCRERKREGDTGLPQTYKATAELEKNAWRQKVENLLLRIYYMSITNMFRSV